MPFACIARCRVSALLPRGFFSFLPTGKMSLLVRSRSHESEHLTGAGVRTPELQDENIGDKQQVSKALKRCGFQRGSARDGIGLRFWRLCQSGDLAYLAVIGPPPPPPDNSSPPASFAPTDKLHALTLFPGSSCLGVHLT